MKDGVERDELGRDTLGFLTMKCEHCGAHMFLGSWKGAQIVCLNGCYLPAHLYRILENLTRLKREDVE